MHGVDLKSNTNPKDWWMTEKYDGIRGYWDGNNFFTRDGNLIICPPDWRNKLPKCELDGELWIGYNSFSQTQSILKSNDWENVKYIVFDLCGNEYKDIPYKRRYNKMMKILPKEDINIMVRSLYILFSLFYYYF